MDLYQLFTCIGLLLTLVLFVFVGLPSIFQTYIVRGDSMTPTFQHGDKIVILKHWTPQMVKRNRIIALNLDSKGRSGIQSIYVKRILGLPGDKIVTSLSQLNPSIRDEYRSLHNEFEIREWSIPSGKVFVKGDATLSTADSLVWGPINYRQIVGIVLLKL